MSLTGLSDCYKKPLPSVLEIGGIEVGIAGLAEIMEAALQLIDDADEDIRRALLIELKARNYVPSAVEEEYLEALWDQYQALRRRRREELEESFQGIPREEIPWFPKINESRCEGCSSCVEFCSQQVFEFFDGKSQVVRPYNCLVGKSSCSVFCPDNAISFPARKELKDILRALKARYGTQ